MKFKPESLQNYPTKAGVYLMKDSREKILYVGKAKNLRHRLKQYFAGRDTRAMIPLLLSKLVAIDTIVVATEKQALILENTLIKKHQPQYNILLKDDKTFISLMINVDHEWPMIRLVRCKGPPPKGGLQFGPYTSAYSARQVYDLMTRLFPLRQCSDQELKRRTRPCLLYGIKRCIAPCVNKCTHEEYNTFVDSAIKFLKGQDKQILNQLSAEMKEASANLEYERAGALHNTIKQIEQITKQESLVSKPSGKNSDVYGIYAQADELILSQLIIREGKLVGSEHYNFSNILQSNEELLESFLLQHYDEKHLLPHEIILPFTLPNQQLLSDILFEQHAQRTHLIHPQKGEKKQLIALAEENAKSTFKQQKNTVEIREKTLLDLQEKLFLTRYPRRIECFDISNIAGTTIVGSMVAFTEGEKDTKRYRLFKIRDLHKGDDYQAMHQILTRRLFRAKEEDDLPDLIIVDGGKGQLNIARTVLKELDIATTDLIALTKEAARHDKGLTREKVYLPEQKEPIDLEMRSPLLFFLQKVRDETHRFTINFHRKQRGKKTIKSQLQEVPGIGPVKRKRLLNHFGSLKQIQRATTEELKKVQGITDKDIAALTDYLKQP